MEKYVSVATLLLGLATAFTCLSAEPAELTSARANYQKQIKTLTDPVNARYVSYLETLKKSLGAKGDLDGALAVQKEIDALGGPAKVVSGADKIVIWNQNNAGKADRGTKKINVSLWVGKREVWSKKSIRIDWDPVQQTKVEIPVPTMSADKLRVEVTEFVDGRGATLGEVEFFREGRNVAAKGAVTVSAVWENNPKNVGAMLTDGNMETRWSLPDKQTGWAEITLAP